MTAGETPAFRYQPPPDTGLDILYRDEYLLLVNKPAGLLSVPGRDEAHQDSLSRRVQREYPQARIVHRLDMETSGILLLARGRAMERHFSLLFQTRRIHKRYQAWVEGLVVVDEGQVDLPLSADWPRRPRQKVDIGGKPALTRYRVLVRDPEVRRTRLALEPVTGRSHQLRVHLLSLGHPVTGDRLYGQPGPEGRMLLHACELGFVHPVLKRELLIHSPVPF
ncbi:MAG TPA: RluA family pseudouridine synthase [Thiolinea sp.]|nr:RluA family pseudouridine synthase [Thiolinea sp.]